MTTTEDAKLVLPGVAIFVLEMARSALAQATEATSIEDARVSIAEADGQIAQVLALAKQAVEPQ